MHKDVICIDMGGTQLRAAQLINSALTEVKSIPVNKTASEQIVLKDLFDSIDTLMYPGITAIGIGVPSVVDIQKGIVYDVQNIPSWKEVHLKEILEQRYKVPVHVNNDANCFALGEFYFGKGKGTTSMIGLTIGTGIGAGIIINGSLYAGNHCGAGEFGMIDYLDKNYECYASGQFFEQVYKLKGITAYEQALTGDSKALAMFDEFGTHLGNAIKTILYAFDMDLIILGGSVSKAFPLFEKELWRRIATYVYPVSVQSLKIEVSDLTHSGLLGAAALCFE